MKGKKTYETYRSKWTKRAALLLSVLYLSNPLYQPLQLVFHEVLGFFESHDTVIGYNFEVVDSSSHTFEHEHETMTLGYGHELIDLAGIVLNACEEDPSSEQPIPEIIKIDKHVMGLRYDCLLSSDEKTPNNFFSRIEKSALGHPIKAFQPPQLS